MNERWYSLTIEDAAKKLNTNVSSGLALKEAERRRRRGNGGSIYSPIKKSMLQHAAKVATDITVLIFALASLISAFLDDGKRAGLAFAFALAAFLCAMIGYVMSRRTFESGAELSVPRAKVIRDGRVYVVNCSDVVIGDVLLLEKGDIVPCDCRLISSMDMKTVEFVGKIQGKEKRQLNDKEAAFICRPEEKPNVAEQKNMLVASSVIVSGSGRAMAVRTGRKTFLSLLLGELQIVPDKKKEMKALSELSKLFSKIGLVYLVATVPFTVISMITGENMLGIYDVLLALLALALSSGSEILSGLSYIFPAIAMKKCETSENECRIKYADAMQELNYIDSVFIACNESIRTDKKFVESVFASNQFYDGESAKKGENQALNCFLDLALLGTSHYLNAGMGRIFSGADRDILCAVAVADFAAECGINREILESKYSLVEFSPAGVSGYDTSLIKESEENRIICVSDKSSLLALCKYIRTPEGAVPLDTDKKSDIIRACDQLSKKGKSLTLVASRTSPCTDLDRIGAVLNQLIFEGYIVYSAPYTDTLAERIEEMHEADISVYYASEENAESVITAFNIGIVKGKQEIAYSSAFKRSGKKITDGFGRYRAYLGFDERELETLVKAIKGDNGTLAVISSSTDQLAIMNCANVSVALSDFDEKTGAVKSLSGSSEIVRKNADVLLSRAEKSSGGLEAFYEIIKTSKNTCSALCRFLRYLAFSVAVRTVLTLLPLLVGKLFLSAVQVLFLSAIVDIPAMIYFALGTHVNSLTDSIDDIESLLKSPIKKLAKYFISGFGLGAVMLLLAAVFGSSGTITDTHLSVFAFMGAVLSQLFAAVIISNIGEKSMGIKITVGIHIAIVLIILILAMTLPVIGAFFGISYPGWQVCAAAVLISVIGYVILLVTDRYI